MEQMRVFNYTNYRTFLTDHFSVKKSCNSSWSYGVWARKLGVSSTAVLTNIVNGKRNPGKSVCEKLTKYFQFNEFEREYFEDLVCLDKSSDDPALSIALMEKMSKFHSAKKFTILDDKTFCAISNWHYYTIREMTGLPHFFEDYDWIAKNLMFKVTAREVKKAISDLLRLGLIVRDDSGRLKATDEIIKTSEDIGSEGLKRFHEQMISNAMKTIRKVDVNERDISGRTINIDPKKLPEAKRFIREFRDKFSESFEEHNGDRTYQINIQLFPLTKEIVEQGKLQ